MWYYSVCVVMVTNMILLWICNYCWENGRQQHQQ